MQYERISILFQGAAAGESFAHGIKALPSTIWNNRE
jgi:hypothetical protein